MNRTAAATYLPQYQGKKNIIASIGMGTNSQLVKAILGSYAAAVQQTKKLAPHFRGADFDSTAKAVWNFLKHQIKYKEDSGLLQHLKLPNALVTTGTGDCKSYSLFAAGIMANLGYKVTFRFTGYGTNYPGHVYILASNGTQTLIIDAVWKYYNAEKKPYSYKKDYTMEIAQISGIGCTNCNGNCNCAIGRIQLKKVLTKAKEAVKTTAVKAKATVKSAAPAIVKKAAQLTLKATGMAPRTAFLQLVKLNVHDFAVRLNKKRDQALARWKQLGGNPGELNASINAGKTRKAIFGIQGIGFAAESVATILVAAAPIIASMAVILGKDNRDAETAQTAPTAEGTTTATTTATTLIDAASRFLKNRQQEAAPSNTSGSSTSSQTGGNFFLPTPPSTPPPSEDVPPSTGTSENKWLLPAAAVALFLVLK